MVGWNLKKSFFFILCVSILPIRGPLRVHDKVVFILSLAIYIVDMSLLGYDAYRTDESLDN